VRRRAPLLVLSVFFCALIVACNGGDSMHADTGAAPPSALRIATLSPHLAELVFAVGAGNLLVGVSAYTDYPPAALAIPVIGDSFNLDQERLTLLEPDLLLAWDTGTPAHVVDDLRARGFRVEVITTTGLDDVPAALRKIGDLTGYTASAETAATDFEAALQELADESVSLSQISVFYQVDARPLYTINGSHYVSELIEICGGENIFAELNGLAPLVSVEAVLEREPEVILASTDAGPSAFDEWDRWTDLAANRYSNRFLMPANEIGRATPRLLLAANAVCDALNVGRRNREASRDE
jgi:iron complex transport system substrate-binding protein